MDDIFRCEIVMILWTLPFGSSIYAPIPTCAGGVGGPLRGYEGGPGFSWKRRLVLNDPVRLAGMTFTFDSFDCGINRGTFHRSYHFWIITLNLLTRHPANQESFLQVSGCSRSCVGLPEDTFVF